LKWWPGNTHTGAAAGVKRLAVEESPRTLMKAFEVTAFVQRITPIDNEEQDHQNDNKRQSPPILHRLALDSSCVMNVQGRRYMEFRKPN